jgi:hypothetical protein
MNQDIQQEGKEVLSAADFIKNWFIAKHPIIYKLRVNQGFYIDDVVILMEAYHNSKLADSPKEQGNKPIAPFEYKFLKNHIQIKIPFGNSVPLEDALEGVRDTIINLSSVFNQESYKAIQVNTKQLADIQQGGLKAINILKDADELLMKLRVASKQGKSITESELYVVQNKLFAVMDLIEKPIPPTTDKVQGEGECNHEALQDLGVCENGHGYVHCPMCNQYYSYEEMRELIEGKESPTPSNVQSNEQGEDVLEKWYGKRGKHEHWAGDIKVRFVHWNDALSAISEAIASNTDKVVGGEVVAEVHRSDKDSVATLPCTDGNSIEHEIIREWIAKYWYETEYQFIDNQDHTKANESRQRVNDWIEKNLTCKSNTFPVLLWIGQRKDENRKTKEELVANKLVYCDAYDKIEYEDALLKEIELVLLNSDTAVQESDTSKAK